MENAHPLRYLFVDFDSFFASCEQEDDPRLRERAIAVAPLDSEHTCAIAASRQAKARGIKTGTKIHEARRLCPGLVVVNARHERYVHYHDLLIAEIGRHLPIHKVHSIDEAACQLMGREREPANAMALARAIKAGIAGNVGACLTCSIGIAPSNLLAKIASDMEKPGGLTVLEAHDLPGVLLDLDLTGLPGIGKSMERRLVRAGVATVRNLWDLSPGHARKIWGGVGGERFWYALHGHDIADPPTRKGMIGHSRVLGGAQRRPEAAHAIARELLIKACARLRRYGLTAGALFLSVRERGGGRSELQARFPHTGDNFVLLARLEELWRKIAPGLGDQGAPVKMVAVGLFRLKREEDRMGDLFDATQPGSPGGLTRQENLWRAVDRLNRRYGKKTVALASQREAGLSYIGTKIAFARVPERAEFEE